MGVYCLFRPINHIIIALLDKICLSHVVEALTDKGGDGDNIVILRSMGKWLECRVSHFPESSSISCHIMIFCKCGDYFGILLKFVGLYS